MPILRFSLMGGLFATAIITLPGCVTTQALSVEQCQSGHWKEIGYNDGVAGRSGAYFGKHVEQCSSISTASPNRILWEQGRQEGLKKFCTELNAYKLGREGFAWEPVCPLDNIEKLEEAYSQGRYYYLRQRDLERLSTPYPWGYGRYGGYYGHPHPHWHRPLLRQD